MWQDNIIHFIKRINAINSHSEKDVTHSVSLLLLSLSQIIACYVVSLRLSAQNALLFVIFAGDGIHRIQFDEKVRTFDKKRVKERTMYHVYRRVRTRERKIDAILPSDRETRWSGSSRCRSSNAKAFTDWIKILSSINDHELIVILSSKLEHGRWNVMTIAERTANCR